MSFILKAVNVTELSDPRFLFIICDIREEIFERHRGYVVKIDLDERLYPISS